MFEDFKREDGDVKVNEFTTHSEHSFSSLSLPLSYHMLHYPLAGHQHLHTGKVCMCVWGGGGGGWREGREGPVTVWREGSIEVGQWEGTRGRVGSRESVWRGMKDRDRREGKGIIEMEWIRRVEEKDITT